MEQDKLREHFSEILLLLRKQIREETSKLKEAKEGGQRVSGEKIRALKIAATQTELASMCTIRSFSADEAYNPLKKLS